MKAFLSVIFLFVIVLLQSCIVYQTSPTSLSDAQDKGKVKVVNSLEDEIQLDNIYVKDSLYYGVLDKSHFQLDSNQISRVYLLDSAATKKLNKKGIIITTSIVIGIPLLLLIVAVTQLSA
jgi:hypothetical protein